MSVMVKLPNNSNVEISAMEIGKRGVVILLRSTFRDVQVAFSATGKSARVFHNKNTLKRDKKISA